MIHRPWASRLRNVAGAISFRIVGGGGDDEANVDPVSRYGFPTAHRPAVPLVGDAAACHRARRFNIIVTAFDRPDALSTLLESLLRTNYSASALNGTSTGISLVVHIDAPRPEADDRLRSRNEKTKQVAVNFGQVRDDQLNTRSLPSVECQP